MATCYRHSGRETGVSCSNCGNPICTDCMTATPVGMRCPECARQKTKVRAGAAAYSGGPPVATYVIMGICVVVFFLGGSGPAREAGVLVASAVDSAGQLVGVAEGDFWRLLTYSFLHAPPPFGFIHIGFNMFILFQLGQMMEPSLGKARFLGLYFASVLGGAFGALLLSPEAATVGASGGVFGLMGAAFVLQRARGINPMQTGIGPLILLNLALGFVIPNVSVGGHLGGLAAGVAAAFAVEAVSQRRGSQLVAVAGCALVGVAAIAGSILAANAAVA